MTPDFLVVGAGVAGLRAAIELAKAGEVLVVAKDTLRESSSEYAQGGIAAALNDDDEVELHEHDTIVAGDGLSDREAVHVLVDDGPRAIEQLIEWGAAFDRIGGKLQFAREGAHSRNRVLHAHGDSTGREIARALYEKAASLPNVQFRSFSAITDLLVDNGAIAGAIACDERERRSVEIHARATVLATGGLGHVFLETTNPDVATGDGVATAYRAGAEIGDIEFVQFHPTALHVDGAPRFLLSEALRGDGAYLRNGAGERFMKCYDAREELAPRDVVSRSIAAELKRTGEAHVFLDLTHLDGPYLKDRFPRIYETCLQFGVDMTKTLVPVHPAAHYAMGGVRTDLHGRTSLDRLYAAGEVACTGVHGANRLASNSLLEGLVFGARAGAAMRAQAIAPRLAGATPRVLVPDLQTEQLRRSAWDHCGLVRSARSLCNAVATLTNCAMTEIPHPRRADFERRNIREVALLIARCALAREESRGGHYREDFPKSSDAFQKHSSILVGHEPSFR